MKGVSLDVSTYRRIADDPLHGDRRRRLCGTALLIAALHSRSNPNIDDVYNAGIYLLALMEEQESR